jgi:GNAT superfamily N-acetyltransferase
MNYAEAADRLFEEFPEFASWYEEERDEGDAWTVFGLQGFSGFVAELLHAGSDDGLLRRCFELMEIFAADPALDDFIEVNFLENLGQFDYAYHPELREKARSLLGSQSAALLANNEQGWRNVEEAIAADPTYEPFWVRSATLAELMGPLTVKVRRAVAEEVRTVLLVLTNAGAWLHSKGLTEQWPASFIDDPAWQDRFDRWTAEGRVFVADGGLRGVLGCFRLMDADDHIWAGEPGAALYLHSLAVVRWAANQGVAKQMLDWAVDHAASMGVDELRLDCWGGNDRLRRYYVDAGFQARGEVEVVDSEQGRYSVALFAKRVS